MNETTRRFAQGSIITAVLAIAVPLGVNFEGLRTVPYYDPARILTICYGETQNVKLGDYKTPQECRTLLENRMAGYANAVKSLVKVPITIERWAALTDFSYNVGINAFAKSTVLKKLNAGDTVGACNELMRWRFAAGIELEGLKRRRAAERELCLKGLR